MLARFHFEHALAAAVRMERFTLKEAPMARSQFSEHRLGTVVHAAAGSVLAIVDRVRRLASA
jgi:hypothetical protein